MTDNEILKIIPPAPYEYILGYARSFLSDLLRTNLMSWIMVRIYHVLSRGSK